MIASIKHRGLQRLFVDDDRSKLPADMVERIQEILTLPDASSAIDALNLPGYRLHTLKGDMKGFWSVTVRANWRIVFRFENGQAADVDFMDYH